MPKDKKAGLIQAGDVLTSPALKNALMDLIGESFALEAASAKEAGALGFMARALVQATLPHRKPKGAVFERRNGSFTLTMMAPPKIGLPYGTMPRLILSWLTTEAVRTRSREIVLGQSLSAFMRELGLTPTGGRLGTITRLKDQSRRLFTSTVSCTYDNAKGGVEAELGFRLTDRHMMWWNPKSPDQPNLFSSVVTLSEPFFEEIITRPVPIDLRVLLKLSQSPLALDIYNWLTYRMSYLSQETTIPWPALAAQFGSEYSRTRDFKAAFEESLKAVLAHYPQARVESAANGLVLKPSPPHVARLVQGASLLDRA